MSTYSHFFISIVVTFIFVTILAVVIPAYVEAPVFIPGFTPGPAVWPKAISIAGIFVGIISIITIIPQLSDKKKLFDAKQIKKSVAANIPYLQRICISSIILISYVYLISFIGIIVASTFLLATLFLFIGVKEKTRWMASLTILFPTALYLLFSNVTHTIFPVGSLWENIGLF